MTFSGYAHFSNISHLINAEHQHWIKYLHRNIEAITKILVVLSENLHCKVCDDLSLNYSTKASLANHYKNGHRKETIQYYLDNYTTKTPEELHEIITTASAGELKHC